MRATVVCYRFLTARVTVVKGVHIRTEIGVSWTRLPTAEQIFGKTIGAQPERRLPNFFGVEHDR